MLTENKKLCTMYITLIRASVINALYNIIRGVKTMCKYTIVNQDTCISCGSCGAIAPEIFEYNDEGLSYYIGDDNEGNVPVDADMLDDLEDAHDECPTNSIKMSDEPFEGDPLKEENFVKEA